MAVLLWFSRLRLSPAQEVRPLERLRTPDEPTGAASFKQVLLTIPIHADIERFLWGALFSISFWSAWEKEGSMSEEDAARFIKDILLSRMEFNMLGTIQAVFREELHPSMLLCDGSVLDKADYPELWEVYPEFSKDATTLTLPDLREQFIRGLGTSEVLGDTGGEAEHVLDLVEMPSHSHNDTGHTHTEVTATPFPTLVGAGAPAVYAVSGVGVTGIGNAILDNTGGGEAHNNLPPYYVLAYAMIVKVLP